VRLAGKRFWTWISVAILSVFVKTEGGALAQEQSTTNNPSTTTQLKHNVPPGPNSKITTLAKDKDHKLSSNASALSKTSGLKTAATGAHFPKGKTATESFKTPSGFKSSSGGDDTPTESFKTSSGLKSSSGRDDTPTESAVKTKHRPHKTSK
jgi:hypothetical protein